MHRFTRTPAVAAAAVIALTAGLVGPAPATAQTADGPGGAVSANVVTVHDVNLLEQPVAELEVARSRGEVGADISDGLSAQLEDTPTGEVVAAGLANNLDARLLNELQLSELLVHAEQVSPPDAEEADSDTLLEVPANPLLNAEVASASARALTGDPAGCPGFEESYVDAFTDVAKAEVLPDTIDESPLLALTGRGEDDVVGSHGVIDLVDAPALAGDAVRSVATADVTAVELAEYQIGVISQPRLAVTSPGPGGGFTDAQAAMDAGALEWEAPLVEIRDPDGAVVATLGADEVDDSFTIPGVATISVGDVMLTENGTDGTLAAEGEFLRIDVADELGAVAHGDIAVAPLSASATTPEGGVECPTPVDRVDGPTRVDTSVEVSEDAFETATAAVLARSDDFPDALTASALAAEIPGPILVNPPSSLNDDVGDELERLGVEQVYLAGGTAALSEQVESDVQDRGIETVRLAGNTRYHTAELIAREVADLGGPVDRVVIARDNLFPDALSAGNLATWARAPILLTPQDRLHGNSEETMTDSSVVDGDDAIIVGGTAAVGQGAAADVADAGFSVERLAGAERYATSVAILERVVDTTDATLTPLYFATGRDFSDALVAAPAAHFRGGSLSLVDGVDFDISHATADFLMERREDVGAVKIVGGTAAISDSVVDEIMAILNAE